MKQLYNSIAGTRGFAQDAAVKSRLQKLRRTAVLGLGVGMMLLLNEPRRSLGCERPDGWDDAPYIAAGAAFQTNVLSLRIFVADKTTGQFVGVVNTSATYFNERHVLTAAHNFTGVSQYDVTRCEVGTGPNYATNRGTVVPGFSYQIHPEHNSSSPGSGTDLAVIHLAASLAGPRAVVGTVGNGDIVTHAGFGNTGTASTGSRNDHNSRAWKGPVGDTTVTSYSPTWYQLSRFYPYFPLNGMGLGGDSGGPVYNERGELVGIADAQSGALTGSGATIFLRLSHPDVLSFITTNTIVVPPSPARLALGENQTLSVTGDTNQLYGIEASSDLSAWQEIGVVTNLTGTATFQDPSPSPTQRFYRAVAK